MFYASQSQLAEVVRPFIGAKFHRDTESRYGGYLEPTHNIHILADANYMFATVRDVTDDGVVVSSTRGGELVPWHKVQRVTVEAKRELERRPFAVLCKAGVWIAAGARVAA